jgi:outer membrane receptor for ferrienterochelin and colicin
MYWTDENNTYLVLIDGRDANIELLGETLWGFEPLLIEDIERIEIIRGASSSLYGANSFSGVVSITTRALPEKTSGWVRLSGGEVGILGLAGRASTRIGAWRFSLGGGAEMSSTFTDLRGTSNRMLKFRALAEYNWSGSQQVLADVTLSDGTGYIRNPTVGNFGVDGGVRAVRLAYQSDDLRGHLYWTHWPASFSLNAPFEYGGITLAKLRPIEISPHTIDGEAQWTLPSFWDPLLLIIGGGGRFSWVSSDEMLDVETFSDITNPGYHQPGFEYWEARAGAFVHAEFAPTDWLTVTGGLRLDYNTETQEFLSPRLATVFKAAEGQFLRLGVARAFRKPAAKETRAHFLVDFPGDSPIQGADRDLFLEFMTRVLGNADLDNVGLWSFEAGYLGRFFNDRLSVSLNLYFNRLTNDTSMVSNILAGGQGLPDLENSSYMYENQEGSIDILGSELSVRFHVSRSVSLLASWAYREVFEDTSETRVQSPRNLITLGGRFRTDSGLIGSLYLFSRSEFWDTGVENPSGLMEPPLSQHMDNVFLAMGRLGWRWSVVGGVNLEAGVKLFLPVSPFSAPHFRFHEKGGGISVTGMNYGGVELRRTVTGYLQGSF